MNSSNSSGQQTSDSQGDLDERKRKRTIWNQESARRSRLKKKNQLAFLMAQVAELRKVKQQILTSLDAKSQNYMIVESDNAILRTQLAELSERLQSLDEIMMAASADEFPF